MPTSKEAKTAKEHLDKVDSAQEMILDEMFDDLRMNYDSNLSKRQKLEN